MMTIYNKHKRTSSWGFAYFLLCIICTTVLSIGCSPNKAKGNYTELSGEIFHTFYRINYDVDSNYLQAVDSTFKAFSHSLNPFDSTSLITAINRNESQVTDSMLRLVWRTAYDISERSGGSYDVTCSPFINAWGFGFEKLGSVEDKVLDSLKAFVGYSKIRLEGDKMIKADPRMRCDFSSISKGYCSDLVGEVLQAKGAKNYLVEIGGEIAFRGTNPEGKPWRIGISKPIEDSIGIISDLEVIISLDRASGGLATSGNYRNFKVVEGRKVAHTIDPKTGQPMQTDVLSATILAPSCMLADGLATACMTMTSNEVPSFLSQFAGVEYLLILADESKAGFTTLMSKGMATLVSDAD